MEKAKAEVIKGVDREAGDSKMETKREGNERKIFLVNF